MVESRMTHNFGAGPAALPKPVLHQIQSELLNYQNEGLSILEMSHRSPAFDQIIGAAEERLRRMVGAGQEWAVLFMQGGGTLQFSAAPMNLVGDKGRRLEYVVTGQWSCKAAEEARRLGFNVRVHEMKGEDLSEAGFARLKATLHADGPPFYVYYCDNETIDGIEMPSSDYIASALGLDASQTLLVSDMSSNFLSRPIDMRPFGLVFATAQKNIGPAGVTVVLVRRNLLAEVEEALPKMLDYRLFAKEASLYNTPPVFAIYVTNLVLAWLEDTFQGSLASVDVFSRSKAALLYSAIDGASGRMVNSIPTPFRSRMNVVWQYGRAKDEARFVAAAAEARMVQLKGHRSVGGMRASLYNAITLEETALLAQLLLCTI